MEEGVSWIMLVWFRGVEGKENKKNTGRRILAKFSASTREPSSTSQFANFPCENLRPPRIAAPHRAGLRAAASGELLPRLRLPSLPEGRRAPEFRGVFPASVADLRGHLHHTLLRTDGGAAPGACRGRSEGWRTLLSGCRQQALSFGPQLPLRRNSRGLGLPQIGNAAKPADGPLLLQGDGRGGAEVDFKQLSGSRL